MFSDGEIFRMLTPEPEYHYPTPWEVAEKSSKGYVVVCANGSYTCEASNQTAANIIVEAVNTWYENQKRLSEGSY